MFGRAADGRLVMRCYEGHRALLQMLLGEIGGLLRDDDPDRRVTGRLFPRAYLDPTEDVAEEEWQRRAHGGLVSGKLDAFDDVQAVLARGVPDEDGVIELLLDASEQEHLLGALNDLRLALAELTGVTEPDGATPPEFDPAEPDTIESGTSEPDAIDTAMVLDWLGAMVSDLVELQLDEMDDITD